MDVNTIKVRLERGLGCIIVLCRIVCGSRTTKHGIAILEGLRVSSSKIWDFREDVWYFTRGEKIAMVNLISEAHISIPLDWLNGSNQISKPSLIQTISSLKGSETLTPDN